MSNVNIENRFFNTMLEISKQVRFNAENINSTHLSNFISLILNINEKGNRIFVYGAGRSGFIGRCFAQRLMHLGLNSCFVSDAITHQYTANDALVLISGSGETTSSVAIAKRAKEIGGKLVLLTSNPESTIGKISDINLKIIGKSKDVATVQKTLAPYTSLFDISTLAVLDSIGGVLMEFLDVSEEDINKR
ncbi:MAG: SIS domain-containing protein, partial [Promethearchaeota archaeon]